MIAIPSTIGRSDNQAQRDRIFLNRAMTAGASAGSAACAAAFALSRSRLRLTYQTIKDEREKDEHCPEEGVIRHDLSAALRLIDEMLIFRKSWLFPVAR
jgi:hypothetical protein